MGRSTFLKFRRTWAGKPGALAAQFTAESKHCNDQNGWPVMPARNAGRTRTVQ
jgi:hypothetical protein